jgi:hypothetical protein
MAAVSNPKTTMVVPNEEEKKRYDDDDDKRSFRLYVDSAASDLTNEKGSTDHLFHTYYSYKQGIYFFEIQVSKLR